MDSGWERTIGFVHVSLQEARKLFRQYDPPLTVYEIVPILRGCRNTNYRVDTSHGPFLLRFSAEERAAEREATVCEAFSPLLHVPKLLYWGVNGNGGPFCIYEYISGVPLSVVLEKETCPPEVAAQAGRSAAMIHGSSPKGQYSTLSDFPPFEEWYDLFLDHPRLRSRIDDETAARAKALVRGMSEAMAAISSHTGFIHADFRPANMLLDENGILWILDWEFAGYGHTLADIGQFFRYRRCFSEKAIEAFSREYEGTSGVDLPPRWVDLAKLRDLVNPLQMLCGEAEAPNKYDDMQNLVQDTLRYFGYL